jgi:hypothetical protein
VRLPAARWPSIKKEWSDGLRSVPAASGHCPYSRPVPKPSRLGKPPVSARIARRRVDDLLGPVALLPTGEPLRPQAHPSNKAYSTAFSCSYVWYKALGHINAGASRMYLVQMIVELIKPGKER